MADDVKNVGRGTVVMIRETSGGAPCNLDITALTGFAAYGCAYTVKPPKEEYETIVEESCLDASEDPAASLGEKQPDEMELTRIFDPGGDQTEQLRTWANTAQTLQFCYVYPSGRVDTFCGQIKVYDPQPVTLKEFMKASITILRSGNYKTFTPA